MVVEEISRVFKESFTSVSRRSKGGYFNEGCFKQVSMVFYGSFKGVSKRKSQMSFKEVFVCVVSVFQENFNENLRVF